MVRRTPAESPAASKKHERRWLLLVSLLIVIFAIAGLSCIAASDNNDTALAPQRRFLLAFSASMSTKITAPCNASGTVTASPQAVCNLSVATCTHDLQLASLDLSGHSFRGSIPAFDADAVPEHLNTLDLSSNLLSGTLSTTIGRLSHLSSLRIGGNRLSGSLPPSWSGMHVRVLDLSSNRLASALPAQWSGLRMLGVLKLHENANISGTLPRAWGRLPLLMNASIPALLGDMVG